MESAQGSTPAALGARWNMDFEHDHLVAGRAFCVLTVVDSRSRENVLLEAVLLRTAKGIAAAL